MTRQLYRFAMVAIVVASTSAASAATPALRYSKPLSLPAHDNEELVAAPLDSDVYAATAAQFPDVRLLDAAGNEVAYVLRKSVTTRTHTERRPFAIENPTVRPLDDGGLEITFDIDREKHPEPVRGFSLVSPLRNFERRVQISASADGDDWQPLVDDGLVFDYSQFMDVRNVDLALPKAEGSAAQSSRFRIVIDDVTREQQSQLLELTRNLQGDEESSRTERIVVNRQPFRIDRLQAWYEVEVPNDAIDQKTDYPVSNVRVVQDTDAKATYVYFDSRREPLTELTIKTPDSNFSRPARVEVQGRAAPPGEKLEWQNVIGSTTLTRIDFRGLSREDVTIAVPESRRDHYRIVIENRDSARLDVTNVTARGAVYDVIFLAKPGEQYRLAYGNESVKAPSYDTATLAASLSAGFEPLAATLSEQSTLADVPLAAEPALARLLNDPKFLGGAITLLVAVLAVGLYRATRRLDSLPRDEG
jgi:hypothetical protein